MSDNPTTGAPLLNGGAARNRSQTQTSDAYDYGASASDYNIIIKHMAMAYE